MDRDERKGDGEGDRDGEYDGDTMKSPGRLAGPGQRKPNSLSKLGRVVRIMNKDTCSRAQRELY